MDESVFFAVKLTCPVCNYDFTMTKTKTKVKSNMPIGFEPYLVPIYQNEKNNPLNYEINVCPRCFYTAFHKDFKEKTEASHINMVRAFSDRLKNLGQELNYNLIYRNYEVARNAYVLGAYLYDKEKTKDYIKLGKCYIRIAWYSKELKEYDFYKTALKKALDTYINAYNEIDNFEISSLLLYLVAVINMELGYYEAAVPYVNKLNGDMKAKNLPSIKDKLEDATLKLRKKLKEIEEETKDFTDDQKKVARKKRRDAIQIKAFKKPFGIELSKPDISNLQVREKAVRSDIEEKYGVKLTGKPKLLIIEDSVVISKSIKYAMSKDCDIVGIATNGSEGVQMYSVFKPDFVTLDINMPGIDGVTALKKIKNIDPDAKVIMASSQTDSKTVVQALKAGAIGFITKPVNKEKILEIMRKNQ